VQPPEQEAGLPYHLAGQLLFDVHRHLVRILPLLPPILLLTHVWVCLAAVVVEAVRQLLCHKQGQSTRLLIPPWRLV
jgi:hypothetical protein